MTLRDLLHGVTAQPVAAVSISGIARDSKRVRPGDLFVAISGSTVDGHEFISEAIRRGAAAVLTEKMPAKTPHPCPCIIVGDTRKALALVAARFYGHPSKTMRLIGVTGTNGKTTTTYLLKAMLEASGAGVGLLGTIVYQIGDRVLPSSNTTPGPLELQRYFAQMAGLGLPWCALEVSSHALAQGRLSGVELEAAILTNLGSDHLDYHKSKEAYAAAKRKIFEYVRQQGFAVVNADDPFGRILAETIPNRTVITCGIEHSAKVRVRDIVCSSQGIRATMDSPWGTLPIESPLLGQHNIINIMLAASTLLALGLPISAIKRGLAALDQIPGRLERVPNDADINILIDYAHTADALRIALRSLRDLCTGKLIVVFGCGGDRDRTKRPAMGRIASLLADHVVLTSDNPRGENPSSIIQSIQSGFRHGFNDFEVIPDREQAIVSALSSAKVNDTVLIAGKGHEAYQIFNNISVPFLDRDVVGRWITSRQSVAMGLTR